MFGIGVTELLIILGVALLVLGPQKLPEVAAMLGRGLREFRKTARELEEELDPVRDAFDRDLYDDDPGDDDAESDRVGLIRPPNEGEAIGIGHTKTETAEPSDGGDDEWGPDHPEYESDLERDDAAVAATETTPATDTEGVSTAPQPSTPSADTPTADTAKPKVGEVAETAPTAPAAKIVHD